MEASQVGGGDAAVCLDLERGDLTIVTFQHEVNLEVVMGLPVSACYGCI